MLGGPVNYQPNMFSDTLYRELARKLSPSEEQKFREEVLRLEEKQAQVSERIWNDIYDEKVRFIIVTASGRKFVVDGKNWPHGFVQNLPAAVRLLNDTANTTAGTSAEDLAAE